MLSEETQHQLIQIINQQLDTDFIILFGSFAKGTEQEDSDIDLAYFSKKQLSSYERFILAGQLAVISGCEVDLVDIKRIDTVFIMQVFAYGIPIYMADKNEYIRQQMRAYSMYVTLNEQRASVIESIKKRGSVYGDE